MTRVLSVLISLCVPVTAQLEFSNVAIRGEVRGGDPGLNTTLSVEAYNASTQSRVAQTLVAGDGSFELAAIPSGNYELRLMGRNGETLRSELVTAQSSIPHITFELPDSQSRGKPANGPVDIAQLTHRVDPQALRIFQKAEKAIASQDHKTAIQLLQKTIQADPDFAEAHMELATQYSLSGDAGRSFEESKTAVRLAPGNAMARLNLAIVLFHKNLLPEAELEARAASRLAPANTKASYLTGAILVGEGKLTPETLAYLRKAYQDYPSARELGARLEKRLAQ